jgi:hypothetical protein
MSNEKILFKLNEIEERKYGVGDKEGNIHVIHCVEGARVYVERMLFKEDIISKIKIYKLVGEDRNPSIFLDFYMGNVEIGTRIWDSDIVIFIEYRKPSNGDEYVKGYDIRACKHYDY